MDSFSWRRIYAVCERTGPGFWDEPVNAITNVAFLLAAWLGWRRWRSAGADDWAVAALIGVTASIGVGSFLFHTFATRWALTADVVPIQIFIGGYLLLALRRFLRVPWLAMPVAFLVCWLIVDQWRGVVPWEWGWRWRSYGAALVLLVTVGTLTLLRGLALERRSIRLGLHLLGAAALFTISMIAATNDRAVCHILPIGLHPVWHILNGATLYWLLHVAIAARVVRGIGGAEERERTAATPRGPLPHTESSLPSASRSGGAPSGSRPSADAHRP